MLKRIGFTGFIVVAVVAAASMAACSDSSVPTDATQSPAATPQTPAAAPQTVITQLSCQVDVAAQRVSCAPASPSLGAGASADLILGGQNQYVKVTSTNVVTTGTVSLSADVTIQNLTAHPWGTADGATANGTGVQVFFFSGPTNGVTVSNATGTSNFTAPGQPYFQYSGTTLLGTDGILTPGETSAPINWQFNLNGQSTFAFQLLLKTQLPDEQGILRWTRAVLSQTGGNEVINAVWGSSANDVWVGGTAGATTLHHWDGSTWTADPGAELDDITGIWGSASNNVYAVGNTSIQRYDGSTWTDVISNASSALLAVWGSGPADVYAGGLGGTLVHSTGGSFTAVPSTGLGTDYVDAIWGTSATDVYIGGLGLRHWNGTSWSAVSAGVTDVRSIWGSSATDIWVGAANGALAHLSGGTWSTSTLGSTDISGIWGTGQSDVYAATRGGGIWHYNGSTWTPYSVLTANTAFLGIWGSGRRDVWAVGTDNTFSNNIVVHGTR